MPSRIDEAGHAKAFDYPVAEHWGGDRNVQPREDSNRQLLSIVLTFHGDERQLLLLIAEGLH